MNRLEIFQKVYGTDHVFTVQELERLQQVTELIVRECCQYLDNEAERLYTLSGSEIDSGFQSNFEICAEKCYDNSQGLKEHFGIAE